MIDLLVDNDDNADNDDNFGAMILLIIVLIMLAVVLAIALAVSLKTHGDTDDSDRSFRDQNGDYVYYDQSIIENKVIHRLHPKEAARTVSRLFHSRKGQE